jgi:Tol biopolymer transport system component
VISIFPQHSIAKIGYSYQISGETVGSVVWDEFRISPDEKFVVYSANDGLFLVPMIGGTLTQLSPVGASNGGDGATLEISGDSQWVVYRNYSKVLFSVSASGGAPNQLGPSLDEDAFVSDFIISPDAQRILYRTTQYIEDAPTVYEVYSVPVSGGAAVKIPGATFSRTKISPDGQRVIFSSKATAGVDELFSMPIAGGGVVRLNAELQPVQTGSRGVYSFEFSGDNQNVVYSSSDGLFTVPTDDGVPVKIGADTGSAFEISPDSQRVVYNGKSVLAMDQSRKLLSVPILGGSATELDIGVGLSFEVTLDSQQVVYQDDSGNLFSVPILGGVALKLTAVGFQRDGGYGIEFFRVSTDGKWVVFRSGRANDGLRDIYSISTADGTLIKLNTESGVRDVLSDFQINPNSQGVIYRLGQNSTDIYSVPIAGGRSVKLNVGFYSGVRRFFQLSRNGQFAVYLAGQLLAINLNEAEAPRSEEFCLPIKSKNGNVTVVCM